MHGNENNEQLITTVGGYAAEFEGWQKQLASARAIAEAAIARLDP